MPRLMMPKDLCSAGSLPPCRRQTSEAQDLREAQDRRFSSGHGWQGRTSVHMAEVLRQRLRLRIELALVKVGRGGEGVVVLDLELAVLRCRHADLVVHRGAHPC